MAKEENNDSSKTKKKRGSSTPAQVEEVSNRNETNGIKKRGEERFDTSKPHFRAPKEESTKVVLDERFSSVLTDPRFQLEVQDKYGRKGKGHKKSKGLRNAKDDLSAFYTIQDNDNPNQHDDAKQNKKRNEKSELMDQASLATESSNSESSAASGGLKSENTKKLAEDPASRIAYLTALSRGQIEMSSSSSDDESSSRQDDDVDSDRSTDLDSDSEEDIGSEKIGILDPSFQQGEQIEITYDPSPFLAVMNVDWEHIKAVDIFALASSFTPMGAVKSVRVFPSDFGLERLEREKQFGPKGIWKKKRVKTARKQGDSDSENDEDGIDRDDDNDGDASVADSNENSENGNSEAENKVKVKTSDIVESEFDPEKLRAYEASKLKYFFAVIEFTHPQHADQAYREIDGMEFEHSSAAVDMRAISPEDLESAIKGRQMRDEATSVPSNYKPPDFVVNALQQTNVDCTWEAGDRERERTLTKHTQGTVWEALAESDDLKAYVASDASSDEEENPGTREKGSGLRKLLGLDSDEEATGDAPNKRHESDEESASQDDDSTDISTNGDSSREVTFIPGAKSMEEKIRSKLGHKDEQNELTPWQKYLEKRKQKRKERRAALKDKRAQSSENGTSRRKGEMDNDEDAFFNEDGKSSEGANEPLSKAELELLVAGDDGEEKEKDFDMREIERLEKLKDRRLHGARKRKEADRAANVTGTDFKINVDDDRFRAVLDGSDERFGIDRTDPKFKETPAMQEILAEQTRRRKAKRQKKSDNGNNPSISAKDVSADCIVKGAKPTGGAAALSALVKSLKAKVQQ